MLSDSTQPAVPHSYLAGTVKPLALLAVPALMAYLAFELTPGGEPDFAKVQLFGGLIKTTIPTDLEMLFFVMLLAAFGGFVAAVNQREAVRPSTWLGRLLAYLIQSSGAGCLGAIAYFLIRAGVLRSTATAATINPLGMAMLSLAVGTSSPAIMRRLAAVAADLYGEEPQVARAINRLEQRIENTLANPTLDNFDGSVMVRVLNTSGSDLSMDEDSGYRVRIEESCRLEVRFEAGGEPNNKPRGLHEELRLRNGKDSDLVTFEVAVDSFTVTFDQGRATSTFPPKSPPPALVFDFTVPEFAMSSNQGERRHELFVEISQKNRLLLSIPVTLRAASY